MPEELRALRSQVEALSNTLRAQQREH